MVNLSGKTALVTGASRGIGRATAVALAQGAQVLVQIGKIVLTVLLNLTNVLR